MKLQNLLRVIGTLSMVGLDLMNGSDSINSSSDLQRLNSLRENLSYLERALEEDSACEFFNFPYAIKNEDSRILFFYVRGCLNNNISKDSTKKIIKRIDGEMKMANFEKETRTAFVNYLGKFSGRNFEDVLNSINKAERGYKKINFLEGIIDCYVSKGALYLNKNLKKAKEYAKKATEIAEKIEDIPGKIDSYYLLWLIAKKEKDPLVYFYYSLYWRALEEEKLNQILVIPYNNPYNNE
ncbi:MAG: hypothetical protein ACPLXC_00610 [Candidatus Pacearchaeota archaeon]